MKPSMSYRLYSAALCRGWHDASLQNVLWDAFAAAAAKSLQSCPTPCHPIHSSLPGSPIPGILQARTLESVAISFSNAWKWKVKVKSLRHVQLLATPWTAAYQTPPSMGFSRQEYWSGLSFPSPERYFSVQFSSVTQSCPTLCDPMNHSTPGLPVHHQLPELTQTHVHWVGNAIQPSHLLLSPSPPAPNPSQHQGLFQWVNSSHEVPKVLEFQLQHQFLPMNTQDWSPSGWTVCMSLQSKGLSRVFSNTTVQKHQFFGAQHAFTWWKSVIEWWGKEQN